MSAPEIEGLLGKVLSNVQRLRNQNYHDGDELIFTLETGEVYKLYHEVDCCEDVYIDDIVGDLSDLIGHPILMAEEIHNPQGMQAKMVDGFYLDTSFTWTFYKFATIKGAVTIRWYGSSNGYYSETVSFKEVEEK